MTEWNNQLTEYHDQPDTESVKLLVKHFARTLSDRVTAIFPDALGVKYITAPALRRQVWNAVLAITDEIQDIPQFRQNLLTKSNRKLIQEVYGIFPAGFCLALRKVGQFAQGRDFYIRLHQHLTQYPGTSDLPSWLRRFRCHRALIEQTGADFGLVAPELAVLRPQRLILGRLVLMPLAFFEQETSYQGRTV